MPWSGKGFDRNIIIENPENLGDFLSEPMTYNLPVHFPAKLYVQVIYRNKP